MYKAEEETGENADYLFPEIDNLDFEADLDKAFEEIEALHREKNEDDSLEKAVSTEDIASAKSRGLVPQSGNWQKPKRWVRPEDADVPVEEEKEEKPRKKASEDLVISSETKEAMKSLFGDDFDISDFQDMYSIGLEGFSTEIQELQLVYQDISRVTGTNIRITLKINAEEEQDSPGIVTAEEERILHLTRRDADFERFRIDRQNLISRIRREEGIPTLVNIMEGNRDVVGTMVRSFSRKNGELIVTHDSFLLPTSFQGKGIATDIMAHVEEEYEKLGVSEIRLLANAEIGGYAWARQGYDFSTKNELEEMQDMFSFEIENGGRVFENEDELIDQVQRFTHSWQFANWNPTDEPHGKHFGKKWMLGTKWNAKKKLDKKSKGYKRGKIYYALKRRENEQTS